MKLTKLFLAFALFSATTGAFQTYAAEKQALPGLPAQPDSYFYTGKPFDKDLGAYAFNYRNYDPQISRWTTPDPSGFPNGANNRLYAPIPTTELDPFGLETFTRTISKGLYYSTPSGQWTPAQAVAFTLSVAGGFFTAGITNEIATTIGAVSGLLPNAPSNIQLIDTVNFDGGWKAGDPAGKNFVSLNVQVTTHDQFSTVFHNSQTLEPGQHYFLPDSSNLTEKEWKELSGGIPYPGSSSNGPPYTTPLLVKSITVELTLEAE